MSIETKVRRLNDLMGAELGRNENGKPIYQWHFSETLLYLGPKLDSNGDVVCEMREAANGLTAVEVVMEPRKMCASLDQQWVVCKWCDPGPRDKWVAQFGHGLAYPRNGYVCPTNMCLGQNEEPDLAVTWDVIGKVRAERKKTFADYMAESTKELDRQEKRDRENLLASVGDACTAFGAVPGKKGGVSFPSVGGR